MKKNILKSRAGRLGAIALNSDPEKKRMAAIKATKTRLKNNPNAFSEMGSARWNNPPRGL